MRCVDFQRGQGRWRGKLLQTGNLRSRLVDTIKEEKKGTGIGALNKEGQVTRCYKEKKHGGPAG